MGMSWVGRRIGTCRSSISIVFSIDFYLTPFSSKQLAGTSQRDLPPKAQQMILHKVHSHHGFLAPKTKHAQEGGKEVKEQK